MKRLSLRASLTAWFLGLTMPRRRPRPRLRGARARCAAASTPSWSRAPDLGICEWTRRSTTSVQALRAARRRAEHGHEGAGSRSGRAGAPPAAPFGEPLGEGRQSCARGRREPRCRLGGARGRAATASARCSRAPPFRPDDDPDHPAFDAWCARRASRQSTRGSFMRWQMVALTGVASSSCWRSARSSAPLRPLRELGARRRRSAGRAYDDAARHGRRARRARRPARSRVHVARRVARPTGAAPRTPRTSCAILPVVRNAARSRRHDRTGEEYRRFLDDVRHRAAGAHRRARCAARAADGDGARARFRWST